MSLKNKPKYCPDCVATEAGWAVPKTGELMVATKGLPNPIIGYKTNKPFEHLVNPPKQPDPKPFVAKTHSSPKENEPEELEADNNSNDKIEPPKSQEKTKIKRTKSAEEVKGREDKIAASTKISENLSSISTSTRSSSRIKK